MHSFLIYESSQDIINIQAHLNLVSSAKNQAQNIRGYISYSSCDY